MPCGIVRTDSNNGGQSFRNGTPITEPHNFGNEVDWQTPDPAHFGNPVPPTDPTFNSNPVTWPTPNPAHFGNDVTLPTLSAPTFDPPAGEYEGPQTVTITSDVKSQATYYTSDGSTPSPSNGTKYSGSFIVAVSETIKAVSYAFEYPLSPVGSAEYTIVDGTSLVANTAATDNGSFAGAITTSPIDTTGAEFLIAVVAGYSFGDTLGISDNFGNTWQALPTTGGSPYNRPQLFYSFNPTVGSGHTFTGTATPTDDVSIAVAAFSGLNTTSAVYEAGSIVNGTLSAGTGHAGSITPDNENDLVINGASGVGGGNQVTFGSINEDFIPLDQTGLSEWSAAMLAYLVVLAAPVAVNPTWSDWGSTFGAGVSGAAFAAA
jgi:Chitobiase/beta-hexosaminidase C-terminal domain